MKNPCTYFINLLAFYRLRHLSKRLINFLFWRLEMDKNKPLTKDKNKPLTDEELEMLFKISEKDVPCDFAGRSYGWDDTHGSKKKIDFDE